MYEEMDIPCFLKRARGEPLPAWTPPAVEETPKFYKSVNASPTVVRLRIQDHIRAAAGELVGRIEGMLDDGVIDIGWSLYDYARANNWSTVVAAKVAERFKPVADELLEAMSTDDDELLFAYRGYKIDEIVELAAIYQGFVDDAKAFATNTKKVERKARTKKPPSVEKKLKGFNYLKDCPEFRLVSEDPATIIGAQEVWFFNPTNKTATVYRAIDKGGLQVMGCHMKNFDEANSVAKRIGRDTQENLKCIQTGGKPLRDRLFKTVRGEFKEVSSRVTKNQLILRVVR
jgi:hypothetical protein